MTISRSTCLALALGLALALDLALAACFIAAEPTPWKECSNGNLCPVDTVCSADGTQCLLCGVQAGREECGDGEPRCGDGIRTDEEACDDGNRRDGDSCSSDCQRVCAPRDGRDRGLAATELDPTEDPDPCEATPPAEVDSAIRAGKQ